MSAILEVANLHKSFGGIAAVNGVSLDVREGEILGIIGPNGSGKSTLFNCVLGQLLPDTGEVLIESKRTTGMRPCDLNRLGVSQLFSCCRCFRSFPCATTSSLPVRNIRGRCFRV